MIVKVIRCTVPDGSRDRFSVAQRAWSRLGEVAGFGGQLGGWNERARGEACILGLWKSQAAYDHFMAAVHDPITDENDQASTYESSSVALAKLVLEMQGVQSDSNLALSRSALLRVADCVVHETRLDHFLSMQRTVWSPGMAKAGMLHGWLARVDDGPRFLVASLWPSAVCHQAYLDGPFSELRRLSDAKSDLQSIEGMVVKLESEWQVMPSSSTPGP